MFDNPYFYIAVVIAGIVALALLINWLIPEGYEDSRGFHYGRKDGDKM